jgi:hypothetical protein
VQSDRSPLIYRSTLVMLVIIGGVVGLFTGVQVTRLWELGPVHISAGALTALVANAALGVVAAWALQSRDAAFLPGVGWFLVVLGLLFLPHPGGDIMLPGSGGDVLAFIVLGFAGTFAAGFVGSGLVVAAAARPSRPTPGRPARR